ncbi:MAG: 3-oxoacyl-[acyl-carrier-protein] reductase [Candidatus Omnitrophica bacterium]|nr:3-oxoacyl-[acyl-carrier-protein] reductase [Candidatus Omnitrophota bacterium]
MRLKGKLALVTGAGRGIGKEIASCFVREGADLIICDVQPELVEEAARDLSKTGTKVEGLVNDVTDSKQTTEMVNKILDKFSKIDILVNNAGITRDNLIIKMTEDDWDKVIAVNLKGAFNCIKAVTRSFLKQRHGKIINVASIIGIMGNAGQANYAASKAGIIGLTKAVAREFGSRGINVNAIAPGFIQTAMTDKLSKEVQEKMLAQIPLGRFGKPKDVADLCLFLASEDSSYITGQVFIIDGGMFMQ